MRTDVTEPKATLHRDMAELLDRLSMEALNVLDERGTIRERPEPSGVDISDAVGMVWIGSLSGFEIAPAGTHVRVLHRCDWYTDVAPDALHEGGTFLGNLIVEALRHRAAGCGIPHTNRCPICGHDHRICMSTTCRCEPGRESTL